MLAVAFKSPQGRERTAESKHSRSQELPGADFEGKTQCNMDDEMSFEKLSAECKEFFDKCVFEDEEAGTNTSDFSTECWKSWFEVCTNENQDGVSRNTTLLTFVILVSVVAVTSFGANVLVCIVFCVYRQLRQIKHYFVINLATADIILAAVSVPLFVHNALTGKNRLHIILDITCGTASMMALAAISLERYSAVVYPLRYNGQVTHNRAMIAIVFTWFYAILVSCLSLISLVTPGKEKIDQNVFFGREYVTYLTVASFALPLLIMFVAYWKIFRVAHSHARQIASFQPRVQLEDSGAENEPRQGPARLRFKRELKASKTLMIIMGTHILCWAPLFIYLLLSTYSSSFVRVYGQAAQILKYVSLFLRYCNGLANPIIYCGINRQFRAAITRFVLRRRNTWAMEGTAFTLAAPRN